MSRSDNKYMKTAVIYARYSSDKQTEQSIEGQLYDCYNYAKANNITVIGEYIDRAMTGRNDDRPDFQRMISDSAKHTFELVLVWKLDRFARSTEDAAYNRGKLKRNGVRLLSVKEDFGDSSAGDLMMHVMESFNEFYSADLREKTVRGMHQSALKCQSTGGQIPIGYKIEGKKYAIDEATRFIPETVFRMYAEGKRLAEIARYLNEKGYRTRMGRKFTTGSFYTMLSNEKYIGVYKYRDVRIEGGYEAMIDPVLFDAVQKKLVENKKRAPKVSERENFYLTGKLFCGHCGEPMNGMSGNSAKGKHLYYRCNGVRKHTGCDKRTERKEELENEIIGAIQRAFANADPEELTRKVIENYEKNSRPADQVKVMKAELQKITNKVDNVVNAIAEMGGNETLYTQLRQLTEQKEQKETEIRIAEHKADDMPTVELVKKILDLIQNADTMTDEGRQLLIDGAVSRIYVYDDSLDIYFKGGKNTEIPLNPANKDDVSDNSFACCKEWGAKAILSTNHREKV
jgi:DNA invertase Pin-like site-specific DNA recombinase